MKYTLTVITFISGLIFSGLLHSEKYNGDGAWAVYKYTDGIILIQSVNIYRETPDKGARPTFMVNYGGKSGCYVSVGLTMEVKDLPTQVNKNQMLGALKGVMEQSDLLADEKILITRDSKVQALDLGRIIYARKVIDSDSLAALMLAKDGAIKIKNRDSYIQFSMHGFRNVINKIVPAYCN